MKKAKVNQHHVREEKEMMSARNSYPAMGSAYRWHTSAGNDCLFMPCRFGRNYGNNYNLE